MIDPNVLRLIGLSVAAGLVLGFLLVRLGGWRAIRRIAALALALAAALAVAGQVAGGWPRFLALSAAVFALLPGVLGGLVGAAAGGWRRRVR